MAVKLSEEKKEILENIKKIKAKGWLPTRYAKEINLQYPDIPTKTIHNVANGYFYNEEAAIAILELAAKNKDAQILKKSQEILKD